jgi:hypothetical protein
LGHEQNAGAVMIDKAYITTNGLFDLVCQLLERDERDAVQGDLLESGESPWQSLVAVLGLVVRREAALWTNWRPWLAAFGLALPSSFLLMGFSLSVSRAYQQLGDVTIRHATGLSVGPGLALFLLQRLASGGLVLDGWFRGWVGLPAHGLGQCGFCPSLPACSAWNGSGWKVYPGFASCCFCRLRFGERAGVYGWSRSNQAQPSPWPWG